MERRFLLLKFREIVVDFEGYALLKITMVVVARWVLGIFYMVHIIPLISNNIEELHFFFCPSLLIWNFPNIMEWSYKIGYHVDAVW